MPVDQSLLGCVLSEKFSDESDVRFAEAGIQVDFRVSGTQFIGRWEELKRSGAVGVFLWKQAAKFRIYKPHRQRRGTCVARGFHRALEMSYLHTLGNKVAVGNPVDIAWEPIYAGSRVYPGKGQLSGDGSVGAWAGEWLAGVKGNGGFCQRGQYGSADLSKDNEQWAVANGNRGARFPKELLDECKSHTCSVHRLRANHEIADAIASYFGVARCWNTLFGNRNANGMSVASDTGAHCQAVIGVFVQPNGEDGFVEAQSWGDNIPSGPRELKLKGGESIELPPGCYGVSWGEYQKAQQRSKWWEAHAVSVRSGQEYRK